MHTYPSQHKRHRRQDQRLSLQRILLTLIILCILGITDLVFVVAQEYLGHAPNGQYPTPIPAVPVSPTPKSSSSPTPTPTPTPTQAPTPTPTPLPTPPPDVLGYPLYSGNPHLPEIALTFDDGPNPSYVHPAEISIAPFNPSRQAWGFLPSCGMWIRVIGRGLEPM